jgi:aryl-alcohol dehydrogenase-like predicted oxidoreductase
MTERDRTIVEAVNAAATGLACSPSDVALAWLATQPSVASAITGARTAAQLKSLLTALDLELPAQILQALNDVSDPR